MSLASCLCRARWDAVGGRAEVWLDPIWGTRSQLMSVSCDDENKVFGVVLRTPPSNSTGA